MDYFLNVFFFASFIFLRICLPNIQLWMTKFCQLFSSSFDLLWKSQLVQLVNLKKVLVSPENHHLNVSMQKWCFVHVSIHHKEYSRHMCTMITFNKYSLLLYQKYYVQLAFNCMAVKNTVTASTVWYHRFDFMLRYQQFYQPLLLHHQCKCDTVNKTNNVLVLLWTQFWPCGLPGRVLGIPRYPWTTLKTVDLI